MDRGCSVAPTRVTEVNCDHSHTDALAPKREALKFLNYLKSVIVLYFDRFLKNHQPYCYAKYRTKNKKSLRRAVSEKAFSVSTAWNFLCLATLDSYLQSLFIPKYGYILHFIEVGKNSVKV